MTQPPSEPGSTPPGAVRDASGIIAVRTGWFPKLRPSPRPRKLPRPPLWLNLALLAFATVVGGAAKIERRSLDRRFSALVRQNRSAPVEIQRLRRDLSDMQLDEKTLSRELGARLKYIENLENDAFAIVLDTQNRRFGFQLGDHRVREAPLEVGPPRTIESPSGKRRWSFVRLTGAFNVQRKAVGASWNVPEWVYVANGAPVPSPLPEIPEGLGRYVIELPGGYVIHSPPPPGSPLTGPKPASFLVPESDLAAIWRRIGPGTRVYVF